MTPPRFIIYSPGYNCEGYVATHIDSIRQQTFEDYIHILVSDNSTDSTDQIIQDSIDERTLFYTNPINLRWLHNSVKYITPNISNEEQIIVLVDMDDWLAHDGVLEMIDKIYKEEDVWFTYGQFVFDKGGRIGDARPAKGIIRTRAYRRAPWLFQHLQTFKAFLWKNLDPEDLKLPNGEFAPCAADRGVIYPLLEMCPPDKVRCIQDIVYVYNLSNPICLEKIDRDTQIKCEMYFRNKPRYDILERS